MATRDQLLEAKRLLAGRLLARGLEGRVVGRRPLLSVTAAAAGAASGVHAVGIGRKYVGGRPTRERAIRLYVVQKLPASLLAADALLPTEIDGIPTDVIESPPAFVTPGRRRRAKPARCSLDRQRRVRPLVAGISTAHRDVTAGTLSYFCRSTRAGEPAEPLLALSNNHVFANVNRAAPGDPLYQPGPADGGGSGDRIARLVRFVPVRLGGRDPNRVDAAVGELVDVPASVELCSIGALTGTARAAEGAQVCKHGRTTGYTEGVVTDDSYDALVGMDHADASVVALFRDQMRVEVAQGYRALGLGGDSGSLIVMKDPRRAGGLYFAGPADGSYGVANHIADVLAELEVALA